MARDDLTDSPRSIVERLRQFNGGDVPCLSKDAADTIERLTAALELIAAFKGKTIFSMEPEYRAGANAAYEQAADIAIDALAPPHSR